MLRAVLLYPPCLGLDHPSLNLADHFNLGPQLSLRVVALLLLAADLHTLIQDRLGLRGLVVKAGGLPDTGLTVFSCLSGCELLPA